MTIDDRRSARLMAAIAADISDAQNRDGHQAWQFPQGHLAIQQSHAAVDADSAASRLSQYWLRAAHRLAHAGQGPLDAIKYAEFGRVRLVAIGLRQGWVPDLSPDNVDIGPAKYPLRNNASVELPRYTLRNHARGLFSVPYHQAMPIALEQTFGSFTPAYEQFAERIRSTGVRIAHPALWSTALTMLPASYFVEFTALVAKANQTTDRNQANRAFQQAQSYSTQVRPIIAAFRAALSSDQLPSARMPTNKLVGLVDVCVAGAPMHISFPMATRGICCLAAQPCVNCARHYRTESARVRLANRGLLACQHHP